MPAGENIHPNHTTEVVKNVHFSFRNVSPLLFRRDRHASRFFVCSSSVRPHTMMLSCMLVHPSSPSSVALILSWNRSVAGAAPKKSTLNLWSPSCVLKVATARESSDKAI